MLTRPRARSKLSTAGIATSCCASRRFTRDRELALDALQETFTYLLTPPAGGGLADGAAADVALSRREERRDHRRAQSAPRRRRRRRGARRACRRGAARRADRRRATALSPERREVLTLRFVDDLSLAEIAVALDVPLGTVKSRLHWP